MERGYHVTDEFLTFACLEYTDKDCPEKYAQSQAMLDKQPEHIGQDIYTASIIGDTNTVRDLLQQDSSLVEQKGGPRNWEPLLYLCYGRVISPLDGHNTLKTARVLLASGADPNTNFTYPYGSIFTAVTGALGGGERGFLNQPPHQYSSELAKLLLDAGADPNDGQALYNRMFEANDETIKLLLSYGLNAEHKVNWVKASQDSILDFLLGYAVKSNLELRVSLLLKHGANPNSRDYYNHKSHYENAITENNLQIAGLLKKYSQIRQQVTSEKSGRK